MLDHEAQEQLIEVRAARLVQLRQLRIGEHPRHHVGRIHSGHHHVFGIGVRHGFVPRGEPAREQGDFVFLTGDDALAQRAHGRGRTVCRRPPRDQEGLRVMVDHARHEVHVRGRVVTARAIAHRRWKGLGRSGGGRGACGEGET